MISLRGKSALVTGASRGIGAATALMLADAGANVGIGYRSREAEAAEVVRAAASRGVKAFAHAADIASAEGAASLFERTEREFGALDIFVGNAGIWPAEAVAVADLPDERYLDTMRQNVDSIFYCSRLAARRLGSGGRIVLLSSTAGQRGEAFHADYAASKGAIISFVKALAIELAPRDVTVNAVAPGWVDTEMSESAYRGGEREKIARSIPIGRIATSEDVAGPIVFLCSDLARHITGEILNVNGGSVLSG